MKKLLAPLFLVLVSGCAVDRVTEDEVNEGLTASTEAELAAQEAGKDMSINLEGTAMPIPASESMRLEQGRDGAFTIAGGSKWKEVAPGVFEGDTEGGAIQLIAGAEGHKRAIAQAEAEISSLYDRVSERGEDDASTLKAIQQKELLLGSLKSAQATANLSEPPSAASCSINIYNGPSSTLPFGLPVGAAAIAQISCTGGCAAFTVTAEAITNFGTTGPVSQTNNSVCAALWTAGMAKNGTSGASCKGITNVTPPNVTMSSTFACN